MHPDPADRPPFVPMLQPVLRAVPLPTIPRRMQPPAILGQLAKRVPAWRLRTKDLGTAGENQLDKGTNARPAFDMEANIKELRKRDSIPEVPKAVLELHSQKFGTFLGHVNPASRPEVSFVPAEVAATAGSHAKLGALWKRHLRGG